MELKLEIPGMGTFSLRHLILDYNGTLACDGCLLPEVPALLLNLQKNIEIHLVTADTYGTVHTKIAAAGLSDVVHVYTLPHLKSEAQEKLDFANVLGLQHCAAIGNGVNDALLLKHAALSVAVLGEEGCATHALLNAHILVRNVHDALNLFLCPQRLVTTLRT